jgi:hypothetical protein
MPADGAQTFIRLRCILLDVLTSSFARIPQHDAPYFGFGTGKGVWAAEFDFSNKHLTNVLPYYSLTNMGITHILIEI